MIVLGEHVGDHYGPVSINAPDSRVERQCRKLGQSVVGLLKRLGA